MSFLGGNAAGFGSSGRRDDVERVRSLPCTAFDLSCCLPGGAFRADNAPACAGRQRSCGPIQATAGRCAAACRQLLPLPLPCLQVLPTLTLLQLFTADPSVPLSTGAGPAAAPGGGYAPPGSALSPPLGYGNDSSSLNTLDEPVWETVKRDLRRIYKNLVGATAHRDHCVRGGPVLPPALPCRFYQSLHSGRTSRCCFQSLLHPSAAAMIMACPATCCRSWWCSRSRIARSSRRRCATGTCGAP